MTLQNQLKALFSVILKEIQRNPRFASQVAESLGTEAIPSTATPARKGRRAPGVLDPFDAFDKGNLEPLLNELEVEQLKDIIAEHRMDRSTKAMKWKTKERLIPLILTTVAARTRKGDAFRLPGSTKSEETGPIRFPVSSVDSPSVQDVLRNADIVEILDPRANFCEQIWGQASTARGRTPGTPPHEIKQVEIEVTSTKPEDVERAKLAVERAKKRQ